MAAWTDFLVFIEPHCEGVPQPLAVHCLREAAREFCRETHIWTRDDAGNDVQAGEAEYRWAPAGDYVVCGVDLAKLSGSDIWPVSEIDLDECMPDWRTAEAENPRWFLRPEDGTIRLVPLPTKDHPGGLFVKLALKPSRTAAQCPDFLLEEWGEEIAAGARQRLRLLPGKAWTDPAMAAVDRADFRAGMARAKARVLTSGVGGERVLHFNSLD